MTMDVGQLSQLTTWLDEEHRRDKAELVRLQQRVETQDVELQDQSRIIKDLETRMAGLQTQQIRTTQLEGALEQLKEEIVQMLSQAEDRQQQENREIERVRAVERDNLSKTLNEIRRDLQRIPRLAEELGLRKAEQQRISEALLALQQDHNSLSQEAESKLRGIGFLEDSRQQDSKRIARLQQDSLEALKRIEQHDSRLQRNEDVSQRQEREAEELKGLVAQLRTSQREFSESQLLEGERLKREIAEWVETMEAQVKRMEEFTARMQEFTEAYRQDRQVVNSVERFQEAIRRDQKQVAELQRLSEERQKRQLEEWQDENEKRWRKELLRWEHQWGEQGRRNGQVNERFDEAEAWLAHHRAELDAVWKYFDYQVNYRTQETRRWLGEMSQLIESRPKKE